jgi:hypothetical protein
LAYPTIALSRFRIPDQEKTMRKLMEMLLEGIEPVDGFAQA